MHILFTSDAGNSLEEEKLRRKSSGGTEDIKIAKELTLLNKVKLNEEDYRTTQIIIER